MRRYSQAGFMAGSSFGNSRGILHSRINAPSQPSRRAAQIVPPDQRTGRESADLFAPGRRAHQTTRSRRRATRRSPARRYSAGSASLPAARRRKDRAATHAPRDYHDILSAFAQIKHAALLVAPVPAKAPPCADSPSILPSAPSPRATHRCPFLRPSVTGSATSR